MRKPKGRYLFNARALASVFRARFLLAVKAAGLRLPENAPNKWVVNCIGKGAPALAYSSRYLYRGVIAEQNILANRNGNITFQYLEANTGKMQLRTLSGSDLLWLVLQHVLPKGFRRVRDHGFLHGNAKRRLALVQLVLQIMIAAAAPRPRPVFKCPACRSPMRIVGFLRPTWSSG